MADYGTLTITVGQHLEGTRVQLMGITNAGVAIVRTLEGAWAETTPESVSLDPILVGSYVMLRESVIRPYTPGLADYVSKCKVGEVTRIDSNQPVPYVVDFGIASIWKRWRRIELIDITTE